MNHNEKVRNPTKKEQRKAEKGAQNQEAVHEILQRLKRERDRTKYTRR